MIILLLSCFPKNLPVPPADQALPVDADVLQGSLPNGLRYFAENSTRPQGRAELRLVVNAGSVLEDEDQLGLAHFLEHMAFNGSEHFSGNALIEYFESIGMSFGAHVNAYTSFDETVYTLTIPTDKPELLEKGLLVLRDQAGGLSLDPEEIEKERGVVLEEWRTRQGAGSRITEALLPYEFYGSQYAKRLPIGTPESIKSFDPAVLSRFYHDWYRPNLMAVMVVGDLDEKTVPALVEKYFSDLKNPENPRERVSFPLPPHEPLVATVSDPEVNSPGASLTWTIPDPEGATVGSYRLGLVRGLVATMLNERFADKAQGGAEFIGAGVGFDEVIRGFGAWGAGAGLNEKSVEAGLREVIEELARVKRYGFSEAELERAKAGILASYEAYYRSRNTETASDAIEELVRVFLTGESMPGIEYEVMLARSIVPVVSLEETNAVGKQAFSEGSLLLSLVLPEKVPAPSEVALKGLILELDTLDPGPLQVEATQKLLTTLPAPGKVVETGEIRELGITTWKLSNGVELWIKPTTFEEDEILIGATSPGGLSLVSDSDWYSASVASSIRAYSGIGELDARAVSKALSGSTVSTSLNISRFTEELGGSVAPLDLETLFQMFYLYFTAPRFDQAALDRYKTEQASFLSNRLASPGARFGEAFDRMLWGDAFRLLPWNVADLDKVKLEVASRIFKERFADADDFKWVITGNVNLKKLKPLVERYLGSLPSLPGSDSPKDDGMAMKPGLLQTTVLAGLEPKASVRIRFHGEFENTFLGRNRLFALGDLLEVRLREELREELGGVYGVGVGSGNWYFPKEEYQLTIEFSCDPGRVEELTKATWAVIHELKEKPVEAKYITNIQEINRRDREVSVLSNGFWQGVLLSVLEKNENPLDILSWDERNNSLSPEVLQAAAQQFLKEDSRAEAILLPEAGVQSPDAPSPGLQ